MAAILLISLDLLLPFGATLFLLPVNPQLSTYLVMLWVVLRLLFSPQNRRWILWPLLAVLLLSVRVWWFDNPPYPVSFVDLVLFLAGLFAAASLSLKSSLRISRFLLLCLIPAVASVGSRPWAPNVLAGVNQGAYLLGILCLVSLSWVIEETQCWKSRILPILAFLGSSFLVFQTGSRSAILSTFGAIALEWLLRGRRSPHWWLRLLLVILVLTYPIVRVVQLSPLSALESGILTPESGRIAISQCYLMLPFSGGNRFLYGVGFDGISDFCRFPVKGLPVSLDHAHSLYLQLWASTGMAGAVGILLLVWLWLKTTVFRALDTDFFRLTTSRLVGVYFLIQGIFDLSVLHWPITLVITAILIGMPLSRASILSERSNRC